MVRVTTSLVPHLFSSTVQVRFIPGRTQAAIFYHKMSIPFSLLYVVLANTFLCQSTQPLEVLHT